MSSKEIVRLMVQKIFKNEYKINQKLPSEQQIAIKYQVSRIVATKAYDILKQIGAVYSIPKKGFFVAEHFANLARSSNDFYEIDYFEDQTVDLNDEPFLFENNIVWHYYCFIRYHYQKGKLIGLSKNWVNEDVLTYQEKQDFVKLLSKKNLLESGYTILQFENFPAFGQNQNLVQTNIYYGHQKVAYIQKLVILDSYFKLFKNEWVI